MHGAMAPTTTVVACTNGARLGSDRRAAGLAKQGILLGHHRQLNHKLGLVGAQNHETID